jgi:hypothetical protein
MKQQQRTRQRARPTGAGVILDMPATGEGRAQPLAPLQSVPKPTATPADLVRYALDSKAPVDTLERLMRMQVEWEQRQAKRLFDAAFADFKAKAVTIIRNTRRESGPLQGTMYADLANVVDTVTPALSEHGLSSNWKVTKDTAEWIEVTCYLHHVGGHTESVSMGGPPDTADAKNPIQRRGSTVTYLERYTAKAILGVAEKDDDGSGGDDDDTGAGQRTEATPLQREAERAAARGVDAYAAWWSGITKDQRQELAGGHESRKAIARKADETRAAKTTPTPTPAATRKGNKQ